MALTDIIQKPSRIEFEDKHMRRNTFSGEDELDGESIGCKIPELDSGERIILNAWGSWEVHHYNDHRKRLGIYSVSSKNDEGKFLHYTLKEEEKFSETEMVHNVLVGNFAQTAEAIKNLKYIELDIYGRALSQKLI